MSPKQADDKPSGGVGRGAVTAIIVLVLAVVMLFIVRAQPKTQSYDPRSGSSNGARGLVLLLERYGANVDITRTVPAPGSDTRLLILEDRLNDAQRDDVLAFADDGGTVVVADPASTLHGGPDESGGSEPLPEGGYVGNRAPAEVESNVERGACSIDALDQLRGVYADGGLSFAVAPGTPSCFGDSGNAAVFTQPRGDGLVVAVGDNDLFTNRLLRVADNGPLATALLAPEQGANVAIVLGEAAPKTVADVGSGDKTLVDLVRPGVWMALAQLALAFLVFAVAMGFRSGRPVRESRPVPLEGSEFVAANGNLMQRAGHSQRAGFLLRGDLYRWLCRRVSLPPTAPIDVLDREVAQRDRVPEGTVAGLLSAEVATNDELVALSNRLALFRLSLERHDLHVAPADAPSAAAAAPGVVPNPSSRPDPTSV
jgi:Domain of unknown function (DUF4350)